MVAVILHKTSLCSVCKKGAQSIRRPAYQLHLISLMVVIIRLLFDEIAYASGVAPLKQGDSLPVKRERLKKNAK